MSADRDPQARAPGETEAQRLARLDRVAAQLSRARRASGGMAKRYYRDTRDGPAQPKDSPEE